MQFQEMHSIQNNSIKSNKNGEKELATWIGSIWWNTSSKCTQYFIALCSSLSEKKEEEKTFGSVFNSQIKVASRRRDREREKTTPKHQEEANTLKVK